MLYSPNQKDKTIVGVFLGGKNLVAGRVKGGKIEQLSNLIIDNKAPEEDVLADVITSIQEVITDDVEGIGIGVPSVVDTTRGIVYKVTNIPSWIEVHLKDIIEEKFNRKVLINNDANCFAVGEKHFGKAQSYRNIVGLTIGTGMGAGIIVDNKLYFGANCGAGEFCSIPYREANYEYYCSTRYFEEKYGIKSDILLERAEQGDKVALAIYEQFGFDLGNAIKTILFAVDPDIIVIGGRITKAYPFFNKAMRMKVKTFGYKNTLNKLKIEVSKNPNMAVLGAAALCIDDM